MLLRLHPLAVAVAALYGPTFSVWAQNIPVEDQALPEVKVTAKTASPSSEHTRSYAPRAITIGSKAPATLRETPQSVSVLTRQRLDDQNLVKLEDALKFTTGMTVTRFDGAGNFNVISSRGFDIGSVQLDGLPISQGSNYATALDLAIYDRVEVLRGPSALFQGAGDPGGTINLARKRALGRFQASGVVQAGSWNAYRAEADVSSALNESGSLRGRVVGVVDERDSWVDVVSNQKRVLYGTLEFDLTPDTTLSAGITKQTIRSVIDQGLPAYADGRLLKVDRSTFIGANWNQQNPDTLDSFVELEHTFASGTVIKASARHVEREMLYRGARAASAVTVAGNTNLQMVGFEQEAVNDNLDVYVMHPFDWLGRKQSITVGLSRTEETSRSHTASLTTSTMNVFVPDHHVAEPPLTLPNITSKTTKTQQGLYVQTQLKPWERVTLVLGGRLSKWDTQTRSLVSGATSGEVKASTKFTTTSGLIYDLTPTLSAYTSYSQTFQPQTNLTFEGRLLPAIKGSQIEAGLKKEFFNKRLNAHVAVFRIIDKDRAIADSRAPTASFPGGKVRAQGFEVEVVGQPLQGWDLSAGYARTDTKYLEAPVAQQNQAVFSTFTPKHNITLWSRYAFAADSGWDRFSVGGGLKSVSEFYAQSTAGVRWVQNGYTTASAQLGYRVNEKVSLSLTVNNLFDAKYYEKVSGATRQNFYGEPRSAMVTLRGQF